MTGKYLWTAKAQIANSTSVTQDINNIQSLTINYGRVLSTDPFRGSNVTITGRRPDLLPPIFIGQVIKVETTGTTDNFRYDCYVADFIVNYGFTPTEDTWTIICEDALGSAGRATVTGSVATNNRTFDVMSSIGGLVKIFPDTFTGDSDRNGTQRCSAINITNENLLTFFNQVAATEQGDIFNGTAFLLSGDNLLKLISYKTRRQFDMPVAEFTDTTPQASALAAKYERIEFAGLSQTYADKVIVKPEGLAAQTAGTGNKVYEVSTYDVTTTQGASTAAYILSTLSTDTDVPVIISCIAENQPTDKALAAAKPSAWINIALRGDQYTCKVEGGTISVTPSQTRFTYNLTLQPQNSFNFVLDSTHYGVLDTNKLG